MLSNNLRYYRKMAGLTQEELAKKINVTKMTISHYESGQREADSSVILKLAKALNIKTYDLVLSVNPNLVITHGDFKKASGCFHEKVKLACDSVDRYLNRFFNIVTILGGNVLPRFKALEKIKFVEPKKCAERLRVFLGLPAFMTVPNLIDLLEEKGIVVCQLENVNRQIYGLNGTVNQRPYVMINNQLSPTQQRFTVIHELIHLLFNFSKKDEAQKESLIDKSAGMFFIGSEDLKRELGFHRTNILNDLLPLKQKYGVDIKTILHRANEENIIDSKTYKKHLAYIRKNKLTDNSQFELYPEKSVLLRQLVFRGLSENLINSSKAAELLGYTLQEQLLALGK